MKNKKQKDKRNWKGYENDLLDRKRRVIEFFFKRPTKEGLERELEEMNSCKRGRKFEIPDSIVQFTEFFKHNFGTDDRSLAIFISNLMALVLGINHQFVHSTIVKRRAEMELDIPFRITPERLAGKRLYFDGTCLRVGRGGYYRSKAYKTEVKFLKIGVFTDDEGKVVDFVIGDEHDAEINMIREKLPRIKRSKIKALVIDGAGSAKDVIVGLHKNRIKPVIRASKAVIKSMQTNPPPSVCAKRKKYEEIVWENYAKEQINYERWRKETGYSKRWVFSEGKFSSFKRMFGEETVSRTQKALHDEICIKFMLLDGLIPSLWK